MLPVDPGTRLRMLECWLPLAQDVSTTEGWGCDGPSLEAVILVALPSLREACSTDDARAILRRVYHLYRRYQRAAS